MWWSEFVAALAIHIVGLAVIFWLMKNLLPLIVLGTLVNFVMVLTTLVHHPVWGVVVGLLIPLLGTRTDHMPKDTWMLLPFLSGGNLALLSVYSARTMRPLFDRVIVAAISKTLVVAVGCAVILIGMKLPGRSRDRIWTALKVQAFTALAGTFMAERMFAQFYPNALQPGANA